MLEGETKDEPSVTSDWQPRGVLIEGVTLKEVRHVPGDRAILTEAFREDWTPGPPVAQVFCVRLRHGAISAWHRHHLAVDRLFAIVGHLKIVLYDDREGSATRGLVNPFWVGEARPTLIVVPKLVWHGIANVGTSEALIVNMPSVAYAYDDPDHWRVPAHSPAIPYRW